MKMFYRFVLDGESYDESDIPSFVDHSKYEKILKSRDAFYKSQSVIERKWRNETLNSLSWMFEPEATYGGSAIGGSGDPMYEDILQYRRDLRSYNLTTENRPQKPHWLQ